MIRVTVEHLPDGKEAGKLKLGYLYITNNRTGDAHKGNYNLHRTGGREVVTMLRGWHRQQDHFWDMILNALLKCEEQVRRANDKKIWRR